MTWYKLRKKIRNRPSLIDPYRSISYEQARKLWKELGRPDAMELMEGARIKAGKTREEWESITGLSFRKFKKQERFCVLGVSRRWAIACIIVLLFASFLAFTTPGRTLAHAIYETFSAIIGDMLHISITDDLDAMLTAPQTPSPPEGGSESPVLFANGEQKEASLAQVQAQLDEPLLYLKGGKYHLDNISVSDSKVMGMLIESAYRLDGHEIRLIQRWPLEDQPMETNLNLEEAVYYAASTEIGLTFEGAYTKVDQSYVGGTVTDTMTVLIYINNLSDLNTVDKIASHIACFGESSDRD